MIHKDEILAAAEKKYAEFLDIILPGWQDSSNTENTPKRVAKMYVNELLIGLYDENKPIITDFENEENYEGMVFQGNIDVKSICSHHMMPFFGKAHVAYIPGSNIIGLSKLNRIVNYCSRKPQVQENLTQDIFNFINQLIPDNKGIAVYLECQHTCVSMRGINQDSTMKTAKVSGFFFTNEVGTKDEFYRFINDLKH